MVNSMLELIGNTPLLRLKRITKETKANIFVKCEFLNPSGSIKDRMALRMIEEAEKEGKLDSKTTIIDQTTGNTGPALSFVGGLKGYKVLLIMPAQLSGKYSLNERIKISQYFGGKVEKLDFNKYHSFLGKLNSADKAAAFVALRMKRCFELERDNQDMWWVNQLCNMNNAFAHRDTTGKEIVEQLDGKVDGWVSSIGSGGTLLGVADSLKKNNPKVVVFGVVPKDDPRLEWARSGVIQRYLKSFGVPNMNFLTEMIVEKEITDEVIMVDDKDARETANRLCKEEGIFCGISSGANVYAAFKLAEKLGEDVNIVTAMVDRRDRYYSEYPQEQYVV
jgi:cysteine synthase A